MTFILWNGGKLRNSILINFLKLKFPIINFRKKSIFVYANFSNHQEKTSKEGYIHLYRF